MTCYRQIYVFLPLQKGPLGRLRRGWEDNIKKNLRVTRGLEVDAISSGSQDIQQQGLVLAVLNLWVLLSVFVTVSTVFLSYDYGKRSGDC
jgi:hypothetical protein